MATKNFDRLASFGIDPVAAASLYAKVSQYQNVIREHQSKTTSKIQCMELTDLKGCGCKVQRSDLIDILHRNVGYNQNEAVNTDGSVGIGLDSTIKALKHAPHLRLVQSIDFFYPIVDDPFLFGMVTVANVLSDVYATGVTEFENMLMTLGVSTLLKDANDREEAIAQFTAGYMVALNFADVPLGGGQTVFCPWFLAGGAVTSVVPAETLHPLDGALPGYVIVLTKPLGTRCIVNAYQKYKKGFTVEGVSQEEVNEAYNKATELMATQNLVAATYLKQFGCVASTDVTGFGLMGHAENLARNQSENVTFRFTKLPYIKHALKIADSFGQDWFRTRAGFAAETSGGLLAVFPPETKFVDVMQQFDVPCFVVGVVEAQQSDAMAIIDPNAEYVSDGF